MRIVVLSSDPQVVFGNGHGCPARMRGLADALARSGHTVTVICAGAQAAESEPASRVTVRPLRLPVSVREIDWHLSHVQPDIVIERLLPGSLEGAEAAAGAQVPHVYDLDLAAAELALGTSTSVRGALPGALATSRGAIAADEATAARLRAMLGPDFPVGVVPDAASREFLSPPSADAVARAEQVLRLAPAQARIAFHGPLGRECGILPLVRALGRIPATQRPKLLVLGDGPERNAALSAAEKPGVGLVLCGRVPPAELPAHLALADIVVVPGDGGSSAPPALLEAMAAGRAVIAPASAGLERQVKAGHEAQLVPFGDPAALAAEIVALLGDGKRRRELGAQARHAIVARHTWDARVGALAALLEPIAASAGDPARWADARPRAEQR